MPSALSLQKFSPGTATVVVVGPLGFRVVVVATPGFLVVVTGGGGLPVKVGTTVISKNFQTI